MRRALAAVLLSSCASAYDPMPVVVATHGFARSGVALVREGVARWSGAGVVLLPPGADVPPDGRLVTFEAVPSGDGWWGRSFVGSNVAYVSLGAPDPALVAAHEAGHLLRRRSGHLDDGGCHLMSSDACRPTPDGDDADFVWDVP